MCPTSSRKAILPFYSLCAKTLRCRGPDLCSEFALTTSEEFRSSVNLCVRAYSESGNRCRASPSSQRATSANSLRAKVRELRHALPVVSAGPPTQTVIPPSQSDCKPALISLSYSRSITCHVVLNHLLQRECSARGSVPRRRVRRRSSGRRRQPPSPAKAPTARRPAAPWQHPRAHH
jgi:hypothetical protein